MAKTEEKAAPISLNKKKELLKKLKNKDKLGVAKKKIQAKIKDNGTEKKKKEEIENVEKSEIPEKSKPIGEPRPASNKKQMLRHIIKRDSIESFYSGGNIEFFDEECFA